jgi:cell division protein FtsL
MYAQVALYGYQRAELSRLTRQAEMQNQALRAEIQTLSSPERLAEAAKNAGMVPSTKVVYIPGPGSVKVAKAE